MESFLEETQRQTEQQLQQELSRISKQLEQRDAVHESLVQELESKIEWYTDRLKTLRKQTWGKQDEKDQLKQRIEAFYQELREERRAHWKDKQQLEAERRDVLLQLDELNADNWYDKLG